MKTKKILLLPVLVLALLIPAFVLTGCGGSYSASGNAPTAEQLTGRWNLTQTQYRGSGFLASATTHRPGTTTPPGWTGGYFISFDADGSFSEQNFWNFALTTLNGTFELNDRNLTLTTSGSQGEWVFVGDRQVGISNDGNTLTMTYTRRQNGTWHYRHTFERA